MADKAPNPAPTEPAGDDDALMMVPMDIASRMQAEDFAQPEYAAAPAPPAAASQGATPARQDVARAFADLMGDEMDADGVSADLIDAGADLVMWGVSASPETVAIMPALDDFTDPEAWRDVLGEIDLPADIETAIAALADEASAAMAGAGEETARRQFAAGLGDLLRQAGVEALAVAMSDGYDWIALNPEDLAREADGQPWAPAGGFAKGGVNLIPIGVSLGLGGRVSLWPVAPAEMRAESSEAQGLAPQRAEPKAGQDKGAQRQPTKH